MCKVHVQLYWGKDAERHRARFRQGLENDETPYGFHLAAEEGYEVTFSRDGRHTLFSRGIKNLFDFDLIHALRNRRVMAGADVIWTMTEGEAFAAAFLMRLGLIPRRPIVSNTVFLLNRWRSLSWIRRRLYEVLSREITVMTVHSESSLPIAREAFPELRVELMYFGVNTDYFTITPPAPPPTGAAMHIVAAGNDRTRDWDTLLEAFGADERFRLSLVCTWLGRERVERYPNLVLLENASADDLRALYRAADVVAVPMRRNVFSGITVALEAAALGKPILSSRTGGVPTYFDEDEVIYAPPDDAEAMREALLATNPAERAELARRAQARLLRNDYSTRGLVRRYSKITQEIFGESKS